MYDFFNLYSFYHENVCISHKTIWNSFRYIAVVSRIITIRIENYRKKMYVINFSRYFDSLWGFSYCKSEFAQNAYTSCIENVSYATFGPF